MFDVCLSLKNARYCRTRDLAVPKTRTFFFLARPVTGYSQVQLPKMKNFFAVLCFLLSAIASATAQTERIISFDSRITVNTDSSIQIQETITVEAAGIDIRHGIYRDFPTRYSDRAGKHNVLFEVVGLRRDGQSEPYHTEDQSNGVRVYFGSSGYDLPPGEHTYE